MRVKASSSPSVAHYDRQANKLHCSVVKKFNEKNSLNHCYLFIKKFNLTYLKLRVLAIEIHASSCCES